MKTAPLLKLAASSLALGGTIMVIAPAVVAGNPVENSRDGVSKIARTAAAKAEKALAARKLDDAVQWAERAVAATPDNADHRFLLGQAYLSAGRFASAETTFGDVLTLNPTHDRAALKLALARIAQGRNGEATALLDQFRTQLSAADYGLAIALAGDTQRAVEVLETAARADDVSSTTRQNLALAYALSGRWLEARRVAAQDLPANLVDKRIVEWAAFARPSAAHEQVASLLGVTPHFDLGQPAALALNVAPAAPMVAMQQPEPAPLAAEPAPVEAVAAVPAATAPVYEVANVTVPVAAPVVAPVTVPVVAAAPVEAPVAVAAPVAPVAPAAPSVTIALDDSAPAQITAPMIHAKATPMRQSVVSAAPRTIAARPIKSGRYVVQLGAYKSSALVRAAWKRAHRRNPALARFDGRQSSITVKGARYYRLSLSGFKTKSDAFRVCARVRASGGNCFVRSLMSNDLVRFAARQPLGTRLAVARKPRFAQPARIATARPVGGTMLASRR